jgi:hypothetical protein
VRDIPPPPSSRWKSCVALRACSIMLRRSSIRGLVGERLIMP